MIKNAVIYCRVSSLEQVQGTSLDQQERECRQFCEREGYQVASVFVDKGESAKTADRPQFQRMVKFCSVQNVDAAVVWKLDRFARNSYDHAVFQAVLAKAGVEVKSVTEPLSDSPAGKLLQTMLAGIAQFDNDVRAERTKSGMRAVASAGGWTTTPPVGYLPAEVNGLFGGPLVITATGKIEAYGTAGMVAHLAAMTGSNNVLSGVPACFSRNTLIAFIQDARSISELLAA